MPLSYPYEQLDVYRMFLDITGKCEALISQAPVSIIAIDHLDRALESIGVNLMRANTRKSGSSQRSTYLDFSIASTHECAASLDVCCARRVIEVKAYEELLTGLWRIRGMLLGLKRVSASRVQEDKVSYGSVQFPFAGLDMYQVALDGVRWIHDVLKELEFKARTRRKLDISTTGTVLNIAEGHGRTSRSDQNRFMKTAEEHAFQTIMMLDLMIARRETGAFRIEDGKAIQLRVISMLHRWCEKNEGA